ncbi:glycosyltransferase [Demequina sp. NBRC 110053]|uniref:glycosyltransferase n=1 Tax=Demequina sp. NBRC 110053 TaxID=1570342 RepID=UPI001F23D523|nr:glycosyltransferase [Demequina sp. NBRC 110053]
MRVSVVMTSCDGERHLAEQLASIVGQRRPPDELVIADDASTDASGDIIAKALASVPFDTTFIVRDERWGLRRNVEDALRRATGDVVVLADQDDVWRPDKLEAVAEAFTDPATALWFSNARLIDDVGVDLGSTSWQAVGLGDDAQEEFAGHFGIDRLLHGQTVTGATMAVRADVVELALPLPEELEGVDHLFLHDGWLAALAALLGAVRVDPRPLVGYRQHGGQVTSMSMARPVAGDAAPAPDPRERIARDLDRTILVARRAARAHDVLADVRDYRSLATRERFLRLRLEPQGLRRRAKVLAALALGQYGRYAAGARTAAADLR